MQDGGEYWVEVEEGNISVSVSLVTGNDPIANVDPMGNDYYNVNARNQQWKSAGTTSMDNSGISTRTHMDAGENYEDMLLNAFNAYKSMGGATTKGGAPPKPPRPMRPSEPGAGVGSCVKGCTISCACKPLGPMDCSVWEKLFGQTNVDCYTNCIGNCIIDTHEMTYGTGFPPGWYDLIKGFAHM